MCRNVRAFFHYSDVVVRTTAINGELYPSVVTFVAYEQVRIGYIHYDRLRFFYFQLSNDEVTTPSIPNFNGVHTR